MGKIRLHLLKNSSINHLKYDLNGSLQKPKSQNFEHLKSRYTQNPAKKKLSKTNSPNTEAFQRLQVLF